MSTAEANVAATVDQDRPIDTATAAFILDPIRDGHSVMRTNTDLLSRNSWAPSPAGYSSAERPTRLKLSRV